MPGRYSLSLKGEELEKRFNAKLLEEFKPRFNAAPSQDLPIITNQDKDAIQFFQWGLVPYSAGGNISKIEPLNARSETLFTKWPFKDIVRRQRCLVPADGYFEWKEIGAKKLPYRIRMTDDTVFSMAGIWESWEITEGKLLSSFAIITTEPNSLIKDLHHRMPAILQKGEEDQWLSDDLSEGGLSSLLRPFEASLMEYYLVSDQVNKVENDFAQLISPSGIAPPGESLSLFE